MVEPQFTGLWQILGRNLYHSFKKCILSYKDFIKQI